MLSRRAAPIMAARRNYAKQFAPDSAARPESADSRSAWGLDGDDADVSTFNGQKSTGIDIQSGGGGGGPAMVTSHQALGIRDTWLNKLGRGVRSLWGTRITEDSTKSDIKIKTTLRELIIYIVFLILLLIMTFGMISSTMFYYTTAIDKTFLKTSGSGVAFVQMSSMEDIWKYLQGPLLDALYPEQWYNDVNYTSSELGYVLHENRLLGAARLRQVRVLNDSCIVADDFSEAIHECYDAYYSGVEDKKPYGLKNGTAWTFMSEKELDGTGYTGEISSYGGGGYTQVLPMTYREAADVIQNLKDNLWIDRGTRAVFVDFTVYNANINLFCVVRMVAELPATGGVVPSWNLRTVKLLRYVTPSDYFVLACEIIFMLFIVYYCIEEAIEIKKVRLAYFKTFWNILDIVVILIAVCCVIFSIYRTSEVNDKLDSLLAKPDDYSDFNSLAYWQITFNSAIAIMVFICWVKVFKYISFNRTMTQLSSTLSKCAKDLAGFAVMFFIFFLAFAQLGYLLFGSQVEEYSSMEMSIFTLFRLILGDFDFMALQQANRILGPAYFILYVFFVFFILLNMFLAIINDTYAEVKSDLTDAQNEFEMGDFFRKGAFKMLERLNIKREKIADIQDVIHEGDINKDGVLDFEEWRSKMKKRGYADAEIEAVFAKYDADGDSGLNLSEQGRMQRDLEDQKVELDSEYDQVKTAGAEASGLDNKEALLIYRRIERNEKSVNGLSGKVESIVEQLERIERAKSKRRETMSKLLENITESGVVPDEARRLQMLRLVRDELSADLDDSDLDQSLNASSHSLIRSRPKSGQE